MTGVQTCALPICFPVTILGEYNKAELVAITLESSWTISLIDNDFRLLEGGGFRLLEDGRYWQRKHKGSRHC